MEAFLMEAQTDTVDGLMDIFSLLYIHMAKEVIETFGKDGEEAVRRAIRNFGIDRGKRLRTKHESEGLPINLKTLFTHYDLPKESSAKRKYLELTETTRYSQRFCCSIQERWREVGPAEYGVIYCDEFHQAMWGAYLEGTVVELPKLLSRGDDYCMFEVYLPGHKKDAEQLLKQQSP
jgi:hypothetical protein